MLTKIRWLHLSDFHVGKDSYEQARLFDEIRKEVERWKNEKDFTPNYVFITGDIANKGLRKEYETFRNGFLLPLQSLLGNAVFFPVPGNHDIERPVPDALDREVLLKNGSKFFDANKEGKTARDQVIKRFNQYKKQMSAQGVSPDWLVKEAGAAIDTRDIAGIQVAVVGLNTAWLCKDDHDKNKLTPGYRLVEAALKQVEKCPVKIVLGHHPLTWWDDAEEQNIRRLFAQHHVIYLHGHKHKSEGRFEEGGVDQFLVLQAGAAFQAREGDQWVNGFTWGELNPGLAEIRVSPRYWVNGEWPPDMEAFTQKRRIDETDWWRFPAPGMTPKTTSGSTNTVPDGWLNLDAETLVAFAREITPEEAQRFFDGAEPDWALAMSSHLPVRKDAAGLRDAVVQFKGEDRPQIALVRGPTAEGKSMALRQIVAAAVEANPDLQVIWHQDETARLKVQEFEALLTEGRRWLVASDHGDMIVKELESLARRLKALGRSNVQFVLAAHDSDWKIAKGDSVLWNSFSRFQDARIAGLSPEDAKALATTWLHFSATGNEPSMQSLSPEQLTERLLASAKDDKGTEGALFGSLLTLRHGRDLRAHARALLQKLDDMPLSSSGSLGEAFRLIAAMHAEGLDFLSANVLQEALACDQASLRLEVLKPLGTEAAASTGAYIRTRHQRIAKAVLEIYDEDDEDVEQIYVRLAAAAINARRLKGIRLDELSSWEYSLSRHFFDLKRHSLAVRIAEKILEVVPDNSHYLVNLARLKRESEDVPGARRLLEAATPPADDRAFWTEWGTVCGMQGDYLANAALHAYSVSDHTSAKTLTREHAKQALAGLAKAFAELSQQIGHLDLQKARAACAWLGLKTDSSDKILKGHQQACSGISPPRSETEAITCLTDGMVSALKIQVLSPSVAEKIPAPEKFTFTRLQTVLSKL